MLIIWILYLGEPSVEDSTQATTTMDEDKALPESSTLPEDVPVPAESENELSAPTETSAVEEATADSLPARQESELSASREIPSLAFLHNAKVVDEPAPVAKIDEPLVTPKEESGEAVDTQEIASTADVSNPSDPTVESIPLEGHAASQPEDEASLPSTTFHHEPTTQNAPTDSDAESNATDDFITPAVSTVNLSPSAAESEDEDDAPLTAIPPPESTDLHAEDSDVQDDDDHTSVADSAFVTPDVSVGNDSDNEDEDEEAEAAPTPTFKAAILPDETPVGITIEEQTEAHPVDTAISAQPEITMEESALKEEDGKAGSAPTASEAVVDGVVEEAVESKALPETSHETPATEQMEEDAHSLEAEPDVAEELQVSRDEIIPIDPTEETIKPSELVNGGTPHEESDVKDAAEEIATEEPVSDVAETVADVLAVAQTRLFAPVDQLLAVPSLAVAVDVAATREDDSQGMLFEVWAFSK